MPQRRPVPRPLLVAGLTVAGLVAVVGGLALRGPGLVAVGVAGALAACLGWGTAREATAPSTRSNTESAVLAAAWTVGVLLVLTGTSVLAGGVAAALLAGAGAVTALVVWVVRTPKDDAPRATGTPTGYGGLTAASRDAEPHRGHPTAARPLAPVTALSTEQLGQEWLESSAALAGRLDPVSRSALVLRRQQALDELERRDPDGFLRWMTTGSGTDRDPSDFVRGRRTAGESAAGTDAA